MEYTFESHGKMGRLDKSLLTLISLSSDTGLNDISRSMIGSSIDKGLVLVNGFEKKKSYKVKVGDVITLRREEVLPVEDFHLAGNENVGLDVLYQDEDIVVLNKQAGIQVHPAQEQRLNDTLVNGLIHHIGIENLSRFEDPMRPGIVHRLDKDTSGVMIVCKNNTAHQNIKTQFQERTEVEKIYFAIVVGQLKEDGFIEKYIKRRPNAGSSMMVTDDTEKGKYALTEYEVKKVWKIDNLKSYTLVRVKLHTGRTHQIRVHFKSLNNPLVGDEIYHKKYKSHYMKQLCLVAKSIQFRHPSTNETIKFEVDFPEHFVEFFDYLNKNSKD